MKKYFIIVILLALSVVPAHTHAAKVVKENNEPLTLNTIQRVLREGSDITVSWSQYDKSKFNYYELVLSNSSTSEKVILRDYITKNTTSVTETLSSEIFKKLTGGKSGDVYEDFSLTLNAVKRGSSTPIIVASSSIQHILIQPLDETKQYEIADFAIGNMNHKKEPFHVTWKFSKPARAIISIQCTNPSARAKLSLEKDGPQLPCTEGFSTLLDTKNNIDGKLNVYTRATVKTPFKFILTMADDGGRVIDRRIVLASLKP